MESSWMTLASPSLSAHPISQGCSCGRQGRGRSIRKVPQNMKNPEQTARKKNKAGDPNCGQDIIIESPKSRCSDSGKKVRPKKLKRLAKQTSSELPDPKKEAGASSPVVAESSSDLEWLTGAKKRNKAFKKEKSRKLFCIQVQNAEHPDKEQPGIDLHAGKKGSETFGSRRDEKDSAMKKKKKKKRKDKPVCLEFLHREEPVKQISGELEPGCQEMPSGRKKRKTVEQKAVGEEVEKKHFEYYAGDPGNVSKKGKCEDGQSGDGLLQRQNDLARRSEKDSKAIKKKKKKLNKLKPASFSCLATIQENPCDMMRECSLKCRSGKEAGGCKTPKGVNKAAEKEVRRKTGKACRFAGASRDISSNVGAPGGKEKRKKAKKRKVEQDDQDGLEDGQAQPVKKKRKNKDVENSRDGGKKVKKEKETKKQITEDEIKLVAFRKGNCDEVKIDKLRRQALQEEIDRESGKTKIAKEGSWSTATLETPEQTTKFHRLMGGFKQGFAPAQSSPANANKSNMALVRPREQELHHNLEAQFKKAVEFKQHRGIGLGFQSSTSHGVHIDKYASKSIKFEA
ncbi:lysine-rich nucleolar protein 1 isoform X2 [Thamnophis elegans]|uniref:lysine-rich nucleolar protein 1 isoform X2 n=1 Tax=Thamnophis elegans TaxID=35005 RepID=UPI001377D4A7|nr:lysine-rich nucleolar protein 1 isoform X2 [Thamnophis elegans]